MPTKDAVYEIENFKAAPDGAPGEFTALVSVFGNVDLVGDRVIPGAFKGSLERWRSKGDPIPVIWSHDAQNPYAHIGSVTSATETPQGLLIKGKNDIANNPFAAQVHQLLVDRRVTNWSFRYDVVNEKRARDGANELIELDLTEVGPTLKGVNSDTRTISAKALLDEAAEKAQSADKEVSGDAEKAGARHSQATRTELSSIRDDANALVSRIDSLLGDEEKAADAQEREAEQIEDPDTKSDDQEPTARSIPSEELRLRSRIEEMRATMRKANGTDSP